MTIDRSMNYEQALKELDVTLRSLEDGTLSLEDAIAAVARGREYLDFCEQKLNEARQRIETLPVHDDLVQEETPPHPATIAELRRDETPQAEIPF